MSFIRWGILGASNFARHSMAPALNAGHHGVLSAIATRSPDKAAPFAALAPGLKVFEDYDALINSDEIDAVYIPLPNNMHVEWSEKAARAGKHVLSEKPLAQSANEIDQLIRTREETGKYIAEAFMVGFHPQWAYVRDLISTGAIGNLRHISGVLTFFNDDLDNIRNRPDVGGGALYDIGVYPVVTSRLVLGQEPQAVSCHSIWENGVDIEARAQLEFPNDVSFDFYVSMRMHKRQEMIFHGDKGLIRINTPTNANKVRSTHVELWHANGDETTRYFSNEDQYVAQVSAFNATALGGVNYPIPLEFSKGNQIVIDALLEMGKQE